ncbi:MAG: hypothetical protein AAGE52_03040, partial [Myxococcota bacterium]
MLARLVAGCMVLSLACGGEDNEGDDSEHQARAHGHGHGDGDGHHRGHGHRHGHGQSTTTEREQPLVRIVRVGGGAGPLRPGQTLDANATLSAGVSEIVMDLRDGARVELLPGSRARLGEEAPAQMLLAEGHLHAILPPMGNSPRPPLRIGTAAGTVEIGGSGDVWVTARPDGTAWVAVLGGRAAVLT